MPESNDRLASPDDWALLKFGDGAKKLTGVNALLLAGMKVHVGKNAVGDTMTEAEFDAGWAEFATLPVGR